MDTTLPCNQKHKSNQKYPKAKKPLLYSVVLMWDPDHEQIVQILQLEA